MSKMFIPALVLFFAIALTGCGRETVDLSRLDDLIHEINPVEVQLVDAVDHFEAREAVRTLTISLMSTRFVNRMDDLAEMYMAANPDVVIQFTEYLEVLMGVDMDQFVASLSTQLMAGTADDLIFTWGREFDFRPYAEAGLLQDWFALMEADPLFEADDFYMNVFEAAAYNGRLYKLPTTFGYEMVAVNNTIPGAAAMFGQHSAVSIADLLYIYANTPAGDGLYLFRMFDVLFGTGRYLHPFLDIENRTADFDSEQFINYIESARRATNFDSGAEFDMIGRTSFSTAELMALSERYYFIYYFLGVGGSTTHYQFLIPSDDELLFGGHLPVVNDEGHLLISARDNLFLNSQSSPEMQELAWDFIRFTQNPDNHDTDSWGWAVTPFSVYRPLMHLYLEQQVPRFITLFTTEFGRQISVSQDEAIWHVTQVLDEIQRMPMVTFPFVGQQLNDIIDDILGRFHNGLISAEQAAADLQSQVMLVLLEIEMELR
ncbi:MAG: extracellular solute-binding protein [Defluviitaleaceae bacterium]|nr:extracellular solute-binding protein [Defluviitaleaceae bacterium]